MKSELSIKAGRLNHQVGDRNILNNSKNKRDMRHLILYGVILFISVINIVYFANVLVRTWDYSEANIVTADGYIRGSDFIALWPALNLAVRGEAELAYDKTEIQTVQQQLTGVETWADRRFLHPPTYLLVMSPLGELSYFTALAAWQLLPLLGFMFVMLRMGLPWALFILLPISGAVVQNIAAGQNGSLMAFFLAGALLTLERRPTVAGLFFGLLTMKPQLALLIAPALIVGRHWRALIAMSATVLAGIVISVIAFGMEIWVVFFNNLFFAQEQLGQGHLPWNRIPSAFVAARLVGLDTPIAQAVQVVVAVVAFAGVAWTWWKPVRFHLKAALLVAAIPFATPWIHDYDLVILLVPIAWLILDSDCDPFRPMEMVVLILLWMFPAGWVVKILPMQGIPYGFALLLAFYGIIFLRILRGRRLAGQTVA
jgi:hypothetical protein